jgi:hypothetical protein
MAQLAHAKKSLKDVAAVSATRYATGRAIKSFGLPTRFWSGGRTKKNRIDQGYAKDHFIDAAYVGVTGESVHILKDFKPLGVGCGFDLTLHNDLNRRGRSTSMWSFDEWCHAVNEHGGFNQ